MYDKKQSDVEGNGKRSPESKNNDLEEDIEYREIAILHANATFGELALIDKKPRAASIQWVEDCLFAVLNKTDYTKVFMKIEKKRMNEKIAFLKSVPYFARWTNMALSKFTYYFKDK